MGKRSWKQAICHSKSLDYSVDGKGNTSSWKLCKMASDISLVKCISKSGMHNFFCHDQTCIEICLFPLSAENPQSLITLASLTPWGWKKWNYITISSFCFSGRRSGLTWLVRSSPEQAVWVRALAGDIVLCSWARHFTPTVPLSTQV